MMLELQSESRPQCEGNSRDHKQSEFWSNTKIRQLQAPLPNKMAKCIHLGWQQEKFMIPIQPLPQTTTAAEPAAYKTMEMSG